MARRTCRTGKIGSALTATSAPTPLGRRDRHLKVASAIWWRRFDVCLGNHQVGGRLVHAFLHNVSHCTHQGQLGDPLRLTIVGRPTVPSVPGVWRPEL